MAARAISILVILLFFCPQLSKDFYFCLTLPKIRFLNILFDFVGVFFYSMVVIFTPVLYIYNLFSLYFIRILRFCELCIFSLLSSIVVVLKCFPNIVRFRTWSYRHPVKLVLLCLLEALLKKKLVNWLIGITGKIPTWPV